MSRDGLRIIVSLLDKEGTAITNNEKFPDKKALVDGVHGIRLKIGISSTPGVGMVFALPQCGNPMTEPVQKVNPGAFGKVDWTTGGQF